MDETKPDQDKVPEKKRKLTKAQRKERARLARLEGQKCLMREQFLREIELSKKSLKRSKVKWEKHLAEIRAFEARKQFHEWGVRSEFLMEKKDQKIDFLMNVIAETNEMSFRNLANHFEQLQYLQNCHKSLVETATKVYEMEALNMLVDSVFELDQRDEMFEIVKSKWENVLHTFNAKTTSDLKKYNGIYLESRTMAAATQIEKCYKMRDEAYEKMKNLRKNLLNFLKVLKGDYVDSQKTAKFIYFMQRQEDYVKENNSLNSVEQYSRKMVSKLQRDLLNLEAETISRSNSKRMEKAYFLNYSAVIKKSIELDKMITHEKLLIVSNQNYEVTKKLKKIVKKGEHLLGVAMCCRRLATENEKVNVMRDAPDETAPIPEYGFQLGLDILKNLGLSPEEIRSHMAIMKNFWHRCSSVQLHNILLTEEKRKLTEENEKYRNIIRSMKKSDDVNYILDSIEIKQV